MTLRITLSAVLLAASVCLTGAASADEPAAETKTEDHRYCVYSGGCSRSLRAVGTFATVEEAVLTAKRLREHNPRYLWIAEGAPGTHNSWSLHFGGEPAAPQSASIYECSRKCGSVTLTTTTNDLTIAAVLAGRMNELQVSTYEPVYHFTSPASDDSE